MNPSTSPLAAVSGLGAVLAALLGCSKPPPEPEDAAAVNLRRIAQAFDVAEYKLRRAPRDEGELRRFLGETGAAVDPDQLLRSPRDGQPYVIRYGSRLDPDGRNTVLAHEKDGVGGRRYVITLSRDVRLLSEQEFSAAEFAGGKKAAGGK